MKIKKKAILLSADKGWIDTSKSIVIASDYSTVISTLIKPLRQASDEFRKMLADRPDVYDDLDYHVQGYLTGFLVGLNEFDPINASLNIDLTDLGMKFPTVDPFMSIDVQEVKLKHNEGFVQGTVVKINDGEWLVRLEVAVLGDAKARFTVFGDSITDETVGKQYILEEIKNGLNLDIRVDVIFDVKNGNFQFVNVVGVQDKVIYFDAAKIEA